MEKHPRLFLISGALCSEPDDFFDRLTSAYNTQQVSSDAIRSEICGGVPRYGGSITQRVQRRLIEDTNEALHRNKNVFMHAYLNTYERREEVMEELIDNNAESIGAKVLILCFDTPVKVCVGRMYRRLESDTLPMRKEHVLSPRKLDTTIRMMHSSVNFPEEEDNHPFIMLDGTRPARELLAKVIERVPVESTLAH